MLAQRKHTCWLLCAIRICLNQENNKDNCRRLDNNIGLCNTLFVADQESCALGICRFKFKNADNFSHLHLHNNIVLGYILDQQSPAVVRKCI